MKPSVKLTAYNTNFDCQDDWDNWVNFVCDNIDEACGFEVGVEVFPMFHGPDKDEVRADTDDEIETIREALTRLWDDWCSGPN